MSTPQRNKKSSTKKAPSGGREAAGMLSDELLKRGEFLEKILDHVPVMIAFIDPQGRTQYVNQYWQQVLGWSLDEARSMDILAQMYPDPQVRKSILALVLAGQGSWRDYRTRTKDNRSIDTTWANVSLSDGSSIGIGYDISGRKQAEQRTKDSEESYRLLFELSPDTITIHDGKTLQLINPAGARMLGASTPDELIGKPILDFVHEDDRAMVRERFERQRNGGSVPPITERLIRLDGSLLDAEVVAAPFRHKGAQASLVIARDITERKQAEEAVQKSERRFRAMIENSWDAIMLVDRQNRVLYYPPPNERITGYKPEDLLGKPADAIIHPDDRQDAEARRRKFFALSDSVVSAEYRIRHKNGEWIWVESTAHNLLDDPTLQAIVIHTRDITERKQAEEALRNSEVRFRALVENGWDGLTLVDRDFNIIYASPSNERIIGYKREERVGRNAQEFIHPDARTRVAEYDRQLADAPGAIHRLEYRARARDGTWKWIESISHNRLDEPGVGAIVINFRDVTERKLAELALIKNENRLNQAVQLAGLGIWDWDLATDRVEWRGEMYRIYGISPEEFTGRGDDYAQFTRADYRAQQRENIAKALEHGVTEAELLAGTSTRPDPKELCIVRPDGSECYTLGDAICIVDEQGKPLHMLGITQDITERKQAEQIQARLTAILEATPDYVGIADPNGHLIYINRAGRQMVGLAEDEDVQNLSIHDLSPAWANKLIAEEGIPTAERDGVWSGETARLTRDGHEIPVMQVILSHRNQRGELEYLSTISRDISERRHAEDKIRRQLARLTALSEIDRAITSNFDLNRSLETLLGHVIHQLGVDAADVLLFDPDLRQMRYAAGYGFHGSAMRTLTVDVGDAFAGSALLEGEIMHIPNMQEHGGQLFRPALPDEEAFVSYSGIPLVAKGELKGILEVFQRQPFHPDEEWLNFLHALAEQAAIAVDNATLFQDLQKSHRELSEAYDATIEGWSRALDLRDKETEGHTQRVTNMTMRLARVFGFSDAELVQIRWGALLHDIGKMGVPDEILFKSGPLTDDEWLIMKKHPTFAYEMLSPIGYLHAALDIPYCHHEKWDGKGYPRGLSGEQIPLSARIFAVVDVWDALRSDRPYRVAWPEEKVRDHIRSLAGSYLDPQVVTVCLESDILTSESRP